MLSFDPISHVII